MALEELQNGRYHRLRLLGTGGMGEVYLMEDTRVSRQVAIKVTRAEASPYPDSEATRDAIRLFQREAKAVAALEHPNILPLYDFGEENLEATSLTYMVMPYCHDGSLASWLRLHTTTNPLSLQDITHLVNQAAEALQFAHDHQVIHLDVKPSNFLLRRNTKNPNRPTLLLADFGLARTSTTTSSSSRTIRGTPTSMAPEQWSSKPVVATDQYALAIMAYEMLTGRPPFIGSMEQLMFQHFSVQPERPSTLNPQLPAAIDPVLLRALAKKPEDRYPSVLAFATAFEQALNTASDKFIAVERQQSSVSHTPDGISNAETISPTSEKPVSAAGTISSSPTLHTSAPPINEKHSFATAGDHNQPTIAASDSRPQALERETVPPLSSPPKKRTTPYPMVIGIISGVLVLLLIGGGILYFTSNNHQSTNNANAVLTTSSQTATALARTAAHTPTASITPTATPQNGLYIADTYNGSMTNSSSSQTTSITVFIRQTRGSGTLNGSVTFTATQQIHTLSGTVDLQGNFSFTAQASPQPYVYYGTVQKNSQGTFLHGNFCNSNTNVCDSNLGFFTVGPGF
ncbi:MAG TPA: serine/threonine-protein kinase [Ktedonobacteraceae bacterium]|nr:serine/threonine-protein kinase [Ktedonobacteraceae bacterium]